MSGDVRMISVNQKQIHDTKIIFSDGLIKSFWIGLFNGQLPAGFAPRVIFMMAALEK